MTETPTIILPSNPIKALDFKRIITSELNKVSSRRRNAIDEEFNSLEELDHQSYHSRAEFSKVALTVDNVRKNRYVDILPGDATRVVLRSKLATQIGDYINANYIDGKSMFGIDTRNYIATQGPKPETVKHFWAMIYEYGCPLILSLTRLEENGMIKCEQYWPSAEEKTVQMDGLVVTLESQEYMGEGQDIVKRVFSVKCNGMDNVHTVVMFHFEVWPDHGVPSSTDSFRLLLRETDDYLAAQRRQNGETGPVCVHCSAGVGRTGTIIAVDAVLEQLKCSQQKSTVDKFSVDLQNVVASLKSIRTWMVQRRSQYAFAYRVLVEEWTARGL